MPLLGLEEETKPKTTLLGLEEASAVSEKISPEVSALQEYFGQFKQPSWFEREIATPAKTFSLKNVLEHFKFPPKEERVKRPAEIGIEELLGGVPAPSPAETVSTSVYKPFMAEEPKLMARKQPPYEEAKLTAKPPESGLMREVKNAVGFATFPYHAGKFTAEFWGNFARSLTGSYAGKKKFEELRKEGAMTAEDLAGGVKDWLLASTMSADKVGTSARERIANRIKERGFVAESVYPLMILGAVKGGVAKAGKIGTKTATAPVIAERLAGIEKMGVPTIRERLGAIRKMEIPPTRKAVSIEKRLADIAKMEIPPVRKKPEIPFPGLKEKVVPSEAPIPPTILEEILGVEKPKAKVKKVTGTKEIKEEMYGRKEPEVLPGQEKLELPKAPPAGKELSPASIEILRNKRTAFVEKRNTWQSEIDKALVQRKKSAQKYYPAITKRIKEMQIKVKKYDKYIRQIDEKLADYPELRKGKLKGLLAEEKGVAELPDFKEVGKKTRAFIESVKKRFPELEGEVEGQYIPRSTDELSIKARNLIKDDINTADKLIRTGTGDPAVATASEFLKHYSDLAQKAKSTGEANVFYDKMAEVAHTIAPKLTELGRGVQAASILSRLTPEGLVRFAAKEIAKYNEALKPWQKRVPDLTGEQAKYITEEMKRIQALPDGEPRAIAYWNLQNYIADFVPSSWYKKIVNFWKAGLLTGIKTTGLNIGATFGNIVLETLKDIPTVTLDILIPGERTTAFTLRGTGRGIVTGFRRGWRYFKTGYDERNIGIKLDYRRVNYGKSKFAKGVQWYVDHVFRSMGAEDQPFFYGSRNKSLYSQAIAQAKNKGLKGAEAKAFVNQLVQNPTDEIVRNAVLDAEIAVHQNRTTLGEAGRQIQKVPGGEFVIPFSRTPAAVAMQMVNYSPAGIVKTIVTNIGKGRFDKRLFVQGMGRGLTGTAILYIGKELFEKSLMTLDYPRSERERKLWELEGKQSNSIKIGGKWRRANIFGPAGFVMLVGGHFKQGMDETGSPWGGITRAMGGSAKSLSEQTFLRGLNQTVEALNNPERFGTTYLRGMAGSGIPTIIGDIARSLETQEVRVESPLESLVSRIPFARGKLEPRIDVLGEELEKGGNFLETMIDPSRPSKIKTSSVIDELKRLWQKGYKVSPTQLGDRAGYKGLTKKQNTLLWKGTGLFIEQNLDKLIKSKKYRKLSDMDKAEIIDRFIDRSKNEMRTIFVSRLIRDLSGTQLENKLKELIEGGLVNRQIFRKLLPELEKNQPKEPR